MPQPQEDLIFGFVILNDLPISSSEKSTNEHFSISKEDLSMTIFSCFRSPSSILLSKVRVLQVPGTYTIL